MTEQLMHCTVMIVDEHKIIEDEEGNTILPKPERLRNMAIPTPFLAQMIHAQRQFGQDGESVVFPMAKPNREGAVYVAHFLTPIEEPTMPYTTGGIN